MGSGYENTIVTGSFNYTVTITSGWMQWFMISSTGGAGVKISGGTLRNCVIMGCSGDGVYCNAVGGTGAALVANCVVVNNNGFGINVDSPGLLTVVNCISRNNTSYGFEGYYNILTISYSNGSRYYTAGNQGCIDQDPLFTSSSDFHIADGSPGWNTGQPSLSDPDGSRSDMGYFGGPDCPIYPVVTQIIISPSGTTINLSAKARANY